MIKDKSKIFEIQRSGKKRLGKEILLTIIPKKISLKKLIINKGKKGGLQFHRKKMNVDI